MPFLCFDVDCDSRLEVDGEMIFENGDLRDQALDKRLVKDCDGGGLLTDGGCQGKCVIKFYS